MTKKSDSSRWLKEESSGNVPELLLRAAS